MKVTKWFIAWNSPETFHIARIFKHIQKWLICQFCFLGYISYFETYQMQNLFTALLKKGNSFKLKKWQPNFPQPQPFTLLLNHCLQISYLIQLADCPSVTLNPLSVLWICSTIYIMDHIVYKYLNYKPSNNINMNLQVL